MNKPLHLVTQLVFTCLRRALERSFCVGSAILLIWLAGCGYGDTVNVQLHSHPPIVQGVPNLEITAQVAGRPKGLHYQWFSVAGGCNPQKSQNPTTTFRFADGTTHDRVSVEVWRDERLVGRSEVDVKLDETQARLLTEGQSHEEA